MGIKQSRLVYTTDRGIEVYVDEMENSHLANTVAHIQKKIEALDKVHNFDAFTADEKQALAGHIQCLHNDQIVLARELANRESCKDDC